MNTNFSSIKEAKPELDKFSEEQKEILDQKAGWEETIKKYNDKYKDIQRIIDICLREYENENKRLIREKLPPIDLPINFEQTINSIAEQDAIIRAIFKDKLNLVKETQKDIETVTQSPLFAQISEITGKRNYRERAIKYIKKMYEKYNNTCLVVNGDKYKGQGSIADIIKRNPEMKDKKIVFFVYPGSNLLQVADLSSGEDVVLSNLKLYSKKAEEMDTGWTPMDFNRVKKEDIDIENLEPGPVVEKIEKELLPKQLKNAIIIEEVFRKAGFSDHVIMAALAYAYKESELYSNITNNLTHTTGLFQLSGQITGNHYTDEERMDPVKNAIIFVEEYLQTDMSDVGDTLKKADENGASISELTAIMAKEVENVDEIEHVTDKSTQAANELFGSYADLAN